MKYIFFHFRYIFVNSPACTVNIRSLLLLRHQMAAEAAPSTSMPKHITRHYRQDRQPPPAACSGWRWVHFLMVRLPGWRSKKRQTVYQAAATHSGTIPPSLCWSPWRWGYSERGGRSSRRQTHAHPLQTTPPSGYYSSATPPTYLHFFLYPSNRCRPPQGNQFLLRCHSHQQPRMKDVSANWRPQRETKPRAARRGCQNDASPWCSKLLNDRVTSCCGRQRATRESWGREGEAECALCYLGITPPNHTLRILSSQHSFVCCGTGGYDFFPEFPQQWHWFSLRTIRGRRARSEAAAAPREMLSLIVTHHLTTRSDLT